MDTPKRSSNSISSSTDENDSQSHEGMSVSKKSAMPQNKHYMSPTISTASKANALRRKVLAERNGLCDSDFHQRSNLDSPKIEDGKIGNGEEGFTESPYDPITNYLTPRPKFLRYKPNRRIEILSRVDNYVKEDGESGSGSGDESSSSQEDDASQEIEEELEEVEERGCSLKGLMKFLVCFIVLVLSTSYISTMNSPTPSPVVQAVAGCKDGYHMIQDQVYEFLKNFDGGKYILVQKEVLELVSSDDVGIQQELVTEIAGKNYDDLSVVVNLNREEVDVVDMIKAEGNILLDDLGERKEEIEDLEILEDEDYPEVNISELENGVLYQELEISEVTEEVEALITIPCTENTASSAPGGTSVTENEVVSELSKGKKVENAMLANDSVTNEVESSAAADGTSETENEVVSELYEEEKVDKAMLTNDSVTNEVESSSKQEIDSMTTMTFLMATGGLLLSVLAALYFQKKRNGRHGISQAVQPAVKQVQENNCSLELAKEVDAPLKNSEPSDSSKSFLDTMERDFSEVYQSGVPTIQLLGEFSVQEMSTSHRSYGMRERIIESEVSSHSVSVENVKNAKPHSSPLHAHSIFSEITSMVTPNQKNIVTPEAYAEGESRKRVTTTPLRRSSRIRDRSIKSP